MISLRARLFLTLVLMTALVWSAAAAWINVRTRQEVEQVLDRRLVEAARMVGSLVASGSVQTSPGVGPANTSDIFGTLSKDYDRQLSCQIWSLEGRLIGRSVGSPDQPLSDGRSGFSERKIEGQTWRVYTLADTAVGARVVVGDNMAVRQNLITDVTTGLLLPALLGILALAGLIWGGLGRGLIPLKQIAETLENRKPEDFSSLSISPVVTELRPFAQAIDGLFSRLAAVRESERHLIASAAHELQTPLAGMYTHAQIALAAQDDQVRDRALRQIIISVDRTARLVRQLLDLAKHEARDEEPSPRWLAMSKLLSLVRSELEPVMQKANVSLTVDQTLASAQIFMNEESLFVVMRNLIENAIQHSPPETHVHCGLENTANGTFITIEDDGTGIAADEIELVRHRFVRGRNNVGLGSGLGLSIADLTLAQSGATLILENRPEGGLRAAIWIEKNRVRNLPV